MSTISKEKRGSLGFFWVANQILFSAMPMVIYNKSTEVTKCFHLIKIRIGPFDHIYAHVQISL